MSVIPQTPRASGGFRPLGPLPGLYPRPAGDLKAVPRPLAYPRPPLTTNPGSAPGSGGQNGQFQQHVTLLWQSLRYKTQRECRGRDRIILVVGFLTTYAISANPN